MVHINCFNCGESITILPIDLNEIDEFGNADVKCEICEKWMVVEEDNLVIGGELVHV